MYTHKLLTYYNITHTHTYITFDKYELLLIQEHNVLG